MILGKSVSAATVSEPVEMVILPSMLEGAVGEVLLVKELSEMS